MKSPRPASRAILAGLFLVSMTGLSACGLTGDLKRGEPLFGKPAKETKPAELPEENKSTLPKLPERKTETPPEADDELLGGPGG